MDMPRKKPPSWLAAGLHPIDVVSTDEVRDLLAEHGITLAASTVRSLASQRRRLRGKWMPDRVAMVSGRRPVWLRTEILEWIDNVLQYPGKTISE